MTSVVSLGIKTLSKRNLIVKERIRGTGANQLTQLRREIRMKMTRFASPEIVFIYLKLCKN